MLQRRRLTPRAGQRDPMYCPERDLAHAGPHLITAGIMRCDQLLEQPWFEAYARDQGVTPEQLGEGARRLGQAMNQIIGRRTPDEALQMSGLLNMPPAVVAMLYILIGKYCLAAIWCGVKDCHASDSEPPISIAQLIEEVDRIADLLDGTTKPPTRWQRLKDWLLRRQPEQYQETPKEVPNPEGTAPAPDAPAVEAKDEQ